MDEKSQTPRPHVSLALAGRSLERNGSCQQCTGPTIRARSSEVQAYGWAGYGGTLMRSFNLVKNK